MSTDPNRSSLAVDPTAAGALRGALKKDKRAAIHQAAQEFEALFLEMVMKSMRATTSQDSLTDSDATRFFTSMFDAQLSKNLSKTGTVGLAQML
ncbi:MAG: rod-binding protein, partial [Zoogloeaceae bacterium]|nr:rod-binding protein [Zoogloeaceae bacterium]